MARLSSLEPNRFRRRFIRIRSGDAEALIKGCRTWQISPGGLIAMCATTAAIPCAQTLTGGGTDWSN
jgi:hypothetical protein